MDNTQEYFCDYIQESVSELLQILKEKRPKVEGFDRREGKMANGYYNFVDNILKYQKDNTYNVQQTIGHELGHHKTQKKIYYDVYCKYYHHAEYFISSILKIKFIGELTIKEIMFIYDDIFSVMYEIQQEQNNKKRNESYYEDYFTMADIFYERYIKHKEVFDKFKIKFHTVYERCLKFLNARNILYPEEFTYSNIKRITKLLLDVRNNESKKRLKDMINTTLSKIKKDYQKKEFFSLLRILINHGQETQLKSVINQKYLDIANKDGYSVEGQIELE